MVSVALAQLLAGLLLVAVASGRIAPYSAQRQLRQEAADPLLNLPPRESLKPYRQWQPAKCVPAGAGAQLHCLRVGASAQAAGMWHVAPCLTRHTVGAECSVAARPLPPGVQYQRPPTCTRPLPVRTALLAARRGLASSPP